MIYFVVALLALLVGWYFAQRADARVSEEGFAKGYQEGDELAAKIFGKTPTEKELILFNAAQLGVWQVPGVIMVACGVGAASMGWFIMAPLAAAGRHLLAVRKWRRAFASHGATLDMGYKWWQKFLFGD